MLLFRLLLRLYPRRYRERYGAEMEDFHRREMQAGGGGLVFWVRLVLDHIEAAWAVRRRERDQRGEGRMRGIMDDIMAAGRSLLRAPRFALFAVATLSLGVGAVTAVFTVVDRVALRPLPYPGSERMALVGIDPRHDPGSLGPLSPALLAALRATPGPADAVVAARGREAILAQESGPERVRLTEVSEEFLDVFGAAPVLGRLLTPSDYGPGAAPVVVLGHQAWRDRFQQDPSVIGRAVRLDDDVYTVAGVLERGFLAPQELVEDADFWVPLQVDYEIRSSFSLAGLARLRPGATLGALDAHADAVVERVHTQEVRPGFLLGATVSSYREAVIGPVARDLSRVLGAVTLLLVIACVNVAGLLLTRGAHRRHELGVHFALGAPRRRLMTRLLSESLLLAAAGGALGAALAWGSVELFRSYAPPGLPRLAEIAVDGRGLVFATGLAAVTVVFFGLLPALRSTRGVGGMIRGSRGSTAGKAESRLRSALVAGETALAVVLAVGSGLLAHDLIRVTQEDPGFRPDGLVSMTLNLEPRYERDAWVGAWDRRAEEARAIPGAGSVAVATQAPWDGSRIASTYRPEGWEGEEPIFASTVGVAGDYVEALGSAIVEGRGLDARDRGGEPVVVVNESFARRYWPGEEAVGRVVASGEVDEEVYRVVGVMADVSTRPGRDVFPHVFHPITEIVWREMDVLVRTEAGDAASLASGLREVVRRVDPTLPVTSIVTMETLSDRALASPRFYAALFGGFALVALLLAVVGVYGNTAYSTRLRLREAGIRLVLGARASQVVNRLVVQSAVAVGLGIAVGLTVAAVGSRLLSDSLRYVQPRDVATYAIVALAVAAAGVAAAWIPAAAAARTDPMNTLRGE